MAILSLLTVRAGAQAAPTECKSAALEFTRAIRKVDAPAEDARAAYAVTDSRYDEESGVEFYSVRRTVEGGEDEGSWGTLLISVYGDAGHCKLVSAQAPVN